MLSLLSSTVLHKKRGLLFTAYVFKLDNHVLYNENRSKGPQTSRGDCYISAVHTNRVKKYIFYHNMKIKVQIVTTV
jgi:hypothetical protein